MDSLDFFQWGLLLVSSLINITYHLETKLLRKQRDAALAAGERAAKGWNECLDEQIKTFSDWSKSLLKEE